MSKNFNNNEIIGYLTIDDRKVTYLKMGVHRLNYRDWLHPDDRFRHLNDELLNIQKWTDFYRKVVGVDDFKDDE